MPFRLKLLLKLLMIVLQRILGLDRRFKDVRQGLISKDLLVFDLNSNTLFRLGSLDLFQKLPFGLIHLNKSMLITLHITGYHRLAP